MDENSIKLPGKSREQELVDVYGRLVTEAATHSWKNFQFLMRGAILLSGASMLTAINLAASETASFSDLWPSILLFSLGFLFSLVLNVMVYLVESSRADHYLLELQRILAGQKTAEEFVGYGFNPGGKKMYFWSLALYGLSVIGGWLWLAPHV